MILSIETSGAMCSVALKTAHQQILSRAVYANTQHSTLLLSMIASLLDEVKCSRSDIKIIVCGVGPGSFTGVRIALSVAQALHLALNIPLVGVDALKNLAYQIVTQAKVEKNGLIWTLIDARLEQLYVACYQYSYCCESNQISIRNLSAPTLLTLEDWLHLEAQQVADIYVGSGLHVLQRNKIDFIGQESSQTLINADCEPLAQSAIDVADMENLLVSTEITDSIAPLYLRQEVAKTEQQRLLKL